MHRTPLVPHLDFARDFLNDDFTARTKTRPARRENSGPAWRSARGSACACRPAPRRPSIRRSQRPPPPRLSWGPYPWANGETARGDGFNWAESDFAGDGTHESPSGQAKVGGELLKFFESDATTRLWFTPGK